MNTPQPIQPHQWTNGDGEVLILKRINKDRSAKNGFAYPSGVGQIVTVTDWDASPKCGGGIHGWPWGFGLGEGMDYDILEDIWLVLSAKPEHVIGGLDGGLKCKCKDPKIRFEGAFCDAWAIVSSEHTKIIQNMAASASGDHSNLAASGDDSVCSIAAMGGCVKVGKRGAVAIAYWDEKEGWLFATGKVGKKGIKADTWYEVREGKLQEIK